MFMSSTSVPFASRWRSPSASGQPARVIVCSRSRFAICSEIAGESDGGGAAGGCLLTGVPSSSLTPRRGRLAICEDPAALLGVPGGSAAAELDAASVRFVMAKKGSDGAPRRNVVLELAEFEEYFGPMFCSR